MKKLLSIGFALFTLLFLNSCLKDKGFENGEYGINTTAVNAEPFVQILGGGLAKFTNSIIKPNTIDTLNIADTVEFRVFYVNNGKPTDKDIVITLAPNSAAIAAYNATPGNSTFELLPDSTFTFTKRTVTVKAGQSFSELTRIIYNPRRINSSKLYLLPISIVDAQGVKISSNNGTIYFNIIGNPQGGVYTNVGIRYNYNCCTSVPYVFPTIPPGFSSTLVLPNPKTASPVDGTTVEIDFANLGGAGYTYLATVPAGLIGNVDHPITLNFSAAFVAGNSNVEVKKATYNPSTKTFHFNVAYLNNITNSNGFRIVNEVLTKQ